MVFFLKAFENHLSIKNIKSKKFSSTFSSENTYTDVVMNVINNFNVANKDIFANFFTDHYNYCIAYDEFLNELKHANLYPSIKIMKSVTRQVTEQ